MSVSPEGNLIISIDRHRQLADGRLYHPGDLIELRLQEDGTLANSSLYFDHEVLSAAARRIWGDSWGNASVNVDGAHVLEDGRILLSVSGSVTAGEGDAFFKDGDILIFDPTNDTASMLFDESSFRRNEDVDAVFLGIGNGELDLLDEMELI